MKKNMFIAVATACALLMTTGCVSEKGSQDAVSFVEDLAEDINADAQTGDASAASSGSAVSGSAASTAFDPNDLFEPALPTEDGSVVFNTGSSSAASSGGSSASDTVSTGKKATDKTAVSADKEEPLPENPDEVLEILFLGDSQFVVGKDNGTDIPSLIRKNIGSKECRVYNMGIPGSCICLSYGQLTDDPADWYSTCFYAMANILSGKIDPAYLKKDYPEVVDALNQFDPKRLDYIVINYGVNDFLRSSVIFDSSNEEMANTCAGAYTRALLLLREACPNARFINLTPLYCEFHDRDGALLGNGVTLQNGQGKTLEDYIGCVQASHDFVEDSFVLNLFNGDYMDLDMYTVNEYLTDGIHLSLRGRKALAGVLTGFIGRREGFDPDPFEIVKIGDYGD